MTRRIDVAKAEVDFSEVQEFEALDKGEYSATIVKCSYVEPASEDKYPYLNVEFDVTEPGSENRKLWKVWSLSPKALFRMKQDLENLGFDVEGTLDIDYDDDTMEVTEPEVVGLPCICVVQQRTYEGRIQNDVAAVLSADSPAKGTKKTAPAAAKKAPATRKPAATTKKFR